MDEITPLFLDKAYQRWRVRTVARGNDGLATRLGHRRRCFSGAMAHCGGACRPEDTCNGLCLVGAADEARLNATKPNQAPRKMSRQCSAELCSMAGCCVDQGPLEAHAVHLWNVTWCEARRNSRQTVLPVVTFSRIAAFCLQGR